MVKKFIFFLSYRYALKQFSRETVKLSTVQILVLVARSLTEIIIEDDRSGERFHVAASCDVGESILSV